MNEQYQATPEQWARLERGAMQKAEWNAALVVLELRDRLAAAEQRIGELEYAENVRQQDEDAASEAENDRRFQACMKAVDEATPEQIRALTDPTGPLVEAVFDAIVQELNHEAEARAAILTVAAWLRQKYSLHAAELLEQEANR